MTISALYEIPRFRHVAESHMQYENSLIPPGGFPPMPVLERYDAGINRVRLKTKLTKEIQNNAAKARASRITQAVVTAFFSQIDLNFMQLVINTYLQDLPFLITSE